jgi:hypothetical protein
VKKSEDITTIACACRKIGHHYEYLIRWKSLPKSKNSWIPLSDIPTTLNKTIEHFHRRHPCAPHLVFEGPVGLQLWTIFGATATATGCQLRQLSTTATATGHNQLQPVETRLQLQLVVTGLTWLLLVTTSYN